MKNDTWKIVTVIAIVFMGILGYFQWQDYSTESDRVGENINICRIMCDQEDIKLYNYDEYTDICTCSYLDESKEDIYYSIEDVRERFLRKGINYKQLQDYGNN